MDEAKAREFLEKHGDLILEAFDESVADLEKLRTEAVRHGWSNIRRTIQAQIDETIAAMRELELLRGEG